MEDLKDAIKRVWKPVYCYENLFDYGYITEFLKPIPKDTLIHDLQYNFSRNVEDLGYYGTEDCPVVKIPIGRINSPEKMADFKEWLDIRHWRIVCNLTKGETKSKIFALERVPDKNVTNKVYKYGVVYHVSSFDRTTTARGADTVMNGGGLRPRPQSKLEFNELTHRVYFAYGGDIKKCVNRLMVDLRISLDDLRIFKVDLTKLPQKIQFYRDPTYEDPNYVYCLTKIPVKYVEEVSIKDL